MAPKLVPEAIVNAAVAMLAPYFPGVTTTGLAEALKHREPTATKPTPRKPLTRHQAAEILQISLASVNRRMKDGTLRWFKISPRLVRIDPASVEALMQAAPAAAPEA